MKHDDTTGATSNGDDFWGGTPDWNDAPRRPRRTKRSGDVTGAIKGLWSSAMSAGADGTREHGALDASAPRPAEDAPVGVHMFDDLDDDYSYVTDQTSAVEDSRDRTAPDPSDAPVIDVFDEDTLAVVAPVAESERQSAVRRSGAIDPLLVRFGAVAIATTLLVPLAIGLASGGDDEGSLTSATTQAAAVSAFDTSVPADAAIVDGDATTSTPAGLDPSSLPPAVPVGQSATGDDGSSAVDSRTQGTASAGSSSRTTDAAAPESAAMQVSEVDAVDDAASADDGAVRINDCATDYTVVDGDFWLRLAEASGVPLAELLEANGATVNTALYPGVDICLPAGATTPAPPASVAATVPAATTTDSPTTTQTPATTQAPTTTASPTTASPTTTAPVTTANVDASPEEVKQIIRDVWPDELEERALEIAYRESRYVPTAKNYCCYGIFQMYWNVHKSWLVDIGITNDQQLYDPETNARAAYALYQRAGGWGPWAL